MAQNTTNNAQPSPGKVNQLIQLFQNQQFDQAEATAKALIKTHPNTFILHHIRAMSLDAMQQYASSAECYKKAITIEPQHPELYFNLGIALSNTGQLQAAIEAYQQAIHLNPQFFEAYGNLGTIYQQLGEFETAAKHYRQGLAINAQDARGHFNLGTVLRDQGLLPDAIKHYQQAIALFPNYVDAYNNLGETLRDHGDMQAAVDHYQKALAINPHHPQANYNMGEFLYLSKHFAKAAQHFETSHFDDWQARSLYCYYKGEQFDQFKALLDGLSQQAKHLSPLVATLATHYAINFESELNYHFCPDPLAHVYHKPISALKDPDQHLLQDLLHDIDTADIAERVQGMLHYGQQSAGNLFKRPEASFQALSQLVLAAFRDYAATFSSSTCELIASFPDNLEFTSSWYVKMNQGGHLSSHIHEIGWISGAVYLAMPPQNGLEGAFEFGTHGDDYPMHAGKTADDFPVGHVMPTVGDIVLFPSSFFHRTIPFSSDTSRICIAFDLKPAYTV